MEDTPANLIQFFSYPQYPLFSSIIFFIITKCVKKIVEHYYYQLSNMPNQLCVKHDRFKIVSCVRLCSIIYLDVPITIR